MRESQAEMEQGFWKGYNACRAKDCDGNSFTIADAQNREAGVVQECTNGHLLQKYNPPRVLKSQLGITV